MASENSIEITEEKNGIKFVSFKLHENTKYSPGQKIWFVFNYKNLLGKSIRYGSMGMAVHRWTGSEWSIHAYQQSFGGPNGRFPAKGREHKDNWKPDQEGILALTPYVSFDKQASHKINKQSKPAAVEQVFHFGQPFYVKIGSSGGIIDSPPAPIVAEKKIEGPPEVEEPVTADPPEKNGAPPDSTSNLGRTMPATKDDDEKAEPSEGTRPSTVDPSQPPLVLHSGTGEISRQIIEWTPGSGVDAVRIDLSQFRGGRWMTHTSLTEALHANNRVELIFLEAGGEFTPTTLIDDSKTTSGKLTDGEVQKEDETGLIEEKETDDTKKSTDVKDIVADAVSESNPLDELNLLAPNTYLLDIEFVSQSGNTLKKDCGPACISMLAENSIEMALKNSGGKKNVALTRQQLITSLLASKIKGEKKAGLTPKEVREYVKQNKPVILLINYSLLPKAVRQISSSNFDHFVVAAGVDDEGIYIHDPLGTGMPGGYFTYLTDAELDKAMAKMAWNNDPRLGVVIEKTYDRLLTGKLTSGYVHEDLLAKKGGLAITKARPNMRWEPIESKESLMVRSLPRSKVLLVLDGQVKNGYLPIRTLVSGVKPHGLKPEVSGTGSVETGELISKKSSSGKLQTGMNVNPDARHGNPMDSDALKGLDWVRFPFKLAAREKESERGEINKAFAQYDVVVSKYAKQGVNSLVVLNQETVGGRVPWQLKDGAKITHPYSELKGEWEEYATRFASTAAQIAAHYREKGFGDNVAYQIWNEGDLQNNPASAYLKPEHMAIILSQATTAIRKEVPKAIIVFNGMATGAAVAVNYIKKVRTTLGGKLPVDALGVHPYGQYVANRPFQGWGFGQIRDYLKIYRDQLPDIPVWITEIGIAQDNPLGSEHNQAISGYLKDIYTYVAQRQSDHVQVLIWFAWSDEMRNAGMVDRQGKVKKHVHAVFEQVRDRKII